MVSRLHAYLHAFQIDLQDDTEFQDCSRFTVCIKDPASALWPTSGNWVRVVIFPYNTGLALTDALVSK